MAVARGNRTCTNARLSPVISVSGPTISGVRAAPAHVVLTMVRSVRKLAAMSAPPTWFHVFTSPLPLQAQQGHNAQ